MVETIIAAHLAIHRTQMLAFLCCYSRCVRSKWCSWKLWRPSARGCAINSRGTAAATPTAVREVAWPIFCGHAIITTTIILVDTVCPCIVMHGIGWRRCIKSFSRRWRSGGAPSLSDTFRHTHSWSALRERRNNRSSMKTTIIYDIIAVGWLTGADGQAHCAYAPHTAVLGKHTVPLRGIMWFSINSK